MHNLEFYSTISENCQISFEIRIVSRLYSLRGTTKELQKRFSENVTIIEDPRGSEHNPPCLRIVVNDVSCDVAYERIKEAFPEMAEQWEIPKKGEGSLSFLEAKYVEKLGQNWTKQLGASNQKVFGTNACAWQRLKDNVQDDVNVYTRVLTELLKGLIAFSIIAGVTVAAAFIMSAAEVPSVLIILSSVLIAVIVTACVNQLDVASFPWLKSSRHKSSAAITSPQPSSASLAMFSKPAASLSSVAVSHAGNTFPLDASSANSTEVAHNSPFNLICR